MGSTCGPSYPQHAKAGPGLIGPVLLKVKRVGPDASSVRAQCTFGHTNKWAYVVGPMFPLIPRGRARSYVPMCIAQGPRPIHETQWRFNQ